MQLNVQAQGELLVVRFGNSKCLCIREAHTMLHECEHAPLSILELQATCDSHNPVDACNITTLSRMFFN